MTTTVVAAVACTAFLALDGAAQPLVVPATKGQSAVVQVSDGTAAVGRFKPNPKQGSTILAFVQTAGAISNVVDNGRTPTTFTRDAFTIAGKGAYVYRANNITLPASGSYKITVTLGS